MAREVIMPQLGVTMEEGEIASWKKEKGEAVEKGEVLLEVLTDKATLEVEAPTSGVLLEKLYQEGDTVPVTQIIGVVGEEGEDTSDILKKAEQEAEDDGGEEEREAIDETPEVEVEKETDESERMPQTAELEETSIVRASPAARRKARELEVELKEIKGSGPRGRITEEDVKEKAEESRYKATPTAEKIAAERGISLSEVAREVEGRIYKEDVLLYAKGRASKREEPLKGLKKAAANTVSKSWAEIPHVTLNATVDMKNGLKVIEKFKDKLETDKLSATDLILKAVAVSLEEYPIMNAHIEGEKIIYNNRVNVGMAVDVSGDLMVPVLKDLDQKGFKAINREKIELAKQAKNGEISRDKLSGSNITVTNLGMYEVEDFTPIINAPASSILGVGTIKKEQVIIEDQVEIRPMMRLSLSFDHRLVNGAPAAQFLQSIKHLLEDPELMLL